MRQFIRRLSRKEGISIFISSHILHEVQLLCDRVAIIDHGKMIWTGQVGQLLIDIYACRMGALAYWGLE